jgi:P27 family predicted phage terminase small subunit
LRGYSPREIFLGGEKVAGSRQPTELLLVKGKKHLTKEEKEQRKNSEVKANTNNIVAPSYLPEEIQEKFKNIADELLSIGIMSNLDCEALARYLSAEHQYQQVTTKILKSKTINDSYIELVKLQEKIFKMARAAASDLGLTISSRCKLVIPKKEEDKTPNKFMKYVR